MSPKVQDTQPKQSKKQDPLARCKTITCTLLILILLYSAAVIAANGIWAGSFASYNMQITIDLRGTALQAVIAELNKIFEIPKVISEMVLGNFKSGLFNSTNVESLLNLVHIGNFVDESLIGKKESGYYNMLVGYFDADGYVGDNRTVQVVGYANRYGNKSLLVSGSWDHELSKGLGPYKYWSSPIIDGKVDYSQILYVDYPKSTHTMHIEAAAKYDYKPNWSLLSVLDFGPNFPWNPLITKMFTNVLLDEQLNRWNVFIFLMDVKSISIKLREILTIPNSLLFIVETNTTNVIGVSMECPLYENENGKFIPMKVNHLQDDCAALGDIYQHVITNFKNLIPFETYHEVVGSHFIAFQIIEQEFDEWLVIYGVPIWSIYKAFLTNIIISTAITILVVLMGLLVGFFISYSIHSNLSKLIAQMEKVTTMNLDSILHTFSFFSEIKQIQCRFYFMVEKLKQYRAYLPTHILNKLHDGSGEDGNEKTLSSFKESKSKYQSIYSTVSAESESLFRLGVDYIEVTVMVVRIENFGNLLKTSTTDYVKIYTQISEVLYKIANKYGGNISMEKETFTISFNNDDSSVRCRKAVNAAIQYIDHHNQLCEKWKGSLLPEVKARIGIATEMVYSGNLGCNQKRLNAFYGNAVILAIGLTYMASDWNTGILIIHPNLISDEKMKKIFKFRPVYNLCVDGGELSYQVFEFVSKIECKKGDEWMYELAVQETEHAYNVFIEGYKLFTELQFSLAIEKFKQSEDGIAKKLIQICEKFIEKQKTENNEILKKEMIYQPLMKVIDFV